MITADTITADQIRELRNEQLRAFRESDPLTCDGTELDYSFAALRDHTVPGLFTGRRISPAEGRARCAEILNARANGGGK